MANKTDAILGFMKYMFFQDGLEFLGYELQLMFEWLVMNLEGTILEN